MSAMISDTFLPPLYNLAPNLNKSHNSSPKIPPSSINLSKKAKDKKKKKKENMGRAEQCIETAPSPIVFPQKLSHSPKLETIREDEVEEEEEEDLNVEIFMFSLVSLLVWKEKGMQPTCGWGV